MSDFRPLHFGDALHVVGGRGHGDERLELREVDLYDLVIRRVFVGNKLREIVGAALGREEFFRPFVGGEDARRDAELGAHVGDRRPLRYAKRFDARTEILNDAADVAFGRKDGEKLQNNVFGGYPFGQGVRELYADDFRPFNGEGFASHSESDVQTARADGEHAESTARRGVGVGAKERFPGLAKAFKVHLVANAVSGQRAFYAEPSGDRPQVEVVVHVVRAHLRRVVVDI